MRSAKETWSLGSRYVLHPLKTLQEPCACAEKAQTYVDAEIGPRKRSNRNRAFRGRNVQTHIERVVPNILTHCTQLKPSSAGSHACLGRIHNDSLSFSLEIPFQFKARQIRADFTAFNGDSGGFWGLALRDLIRNQSPLTFAWSVRVLQLCDHKIVCTCVLASW